MKDKIFKIYKAQYTQNMQKFFKCAERKPLVTTASLPLQKCHFKLEQSQTKHQQELSVIAKRNQYESHTTAASAIAP